MGPSLSRKRERGFFERGREKRPLFSLSRLRERAGVRVLHSGRFPHRPRICRNPRKHPRQPPGPVRRARVIRDQVLPHLEQRGRDAARIALHRHGEIALRVMRYGSFSPTTSSRSARNPRAARGKSLRPGIQHARMPGPRDAEKHRGETVHADQHCRSSRRQPRLQLAPPPASRNGAKNSAVPLGPLGRRRPILPGMSVVLAPAGNAGRARSGRLQSISRRE